MKLSNLNFKSVFAVALMALSSAFFTGCQKEQITGTGNTTPASSHVALNSGQKRMISDMIHRVPVLRVYDKVHNQFIDVDFQKRDFSFSTPNDGWNFSSSTGAQWVPAEDGSGGGFLFLDASALGGNTGGTVVAGNSSIDINYTFCFSASDEALGMNLFDVGGDFTGVSMVLGIGGDFEALMNGELNGDDEDIDFTDYFWGFACYVVYADVASGSYEVLDWFNDLEDDLDDLKDKSFSYVLDFKNAAMYFSLSGNINVSGGSMAFNGTYLGILDFFLDFDDSEEELDAVSVDGFGTMGCS